MREDYLEPAQTVVRILGGIGNTSIAANVHRTRVNRWLLPKENGGTGGLVPSRHHQPLLDWAKENGRPLKPEHFFAVSDPKRRNPARVAA
jgi:hypothetical protein